MSTLADCCPRCWPGDSPVTPPLAVDDTGSSLRASYRCAVCGYEWTCWWDAFSCEWPTPSTVAPSRPERRAAA
jgi:hypothetical protein